MIDFGVEYFFLEFSLLAQGDDVLGAFVSHVGGKFRAIGSTVSLDLGDIFGAEARGCFRVNFFRRFGFCVRLGFLFRVFLLENGAADDRVSFCIRGGFFVLGFREVGGQSGDLIIVQVGAIVRGLGFPCGR